MRKLLEGLHQIVQSKGVERKKAKSYGEVCKRPHAYHESRALGLASSDAEEQMEELKVLECQQKVRKLTQVP